MLSVIRQNVRQISLWFAAFQKDLTTLAEQGTFQLPSACDLPTMDDRVPRAQCSQQAWCAKNGSRWLVPTGLKLTLLNDIDRHIADNAGRKFGF